MPLPEPDQDADLMLKAARGDLRAFESLVEKHKHGVLNYVYWQGKPALVRDAEIDAIRRFMNEYEEVHVEALELKPDARVLIRSGLLMDREATVRRVLHQTVEVLIESLGYKLVAQVDKGKLVPII